MGKVIPNLQLFLILVLLSLFIFGLDSAEILSWSKQGLYFFTNPISFGLYHTKQVVSKQFYFIFAGRTAAQENKALQEQLGELVSENANLKRSLAEVQAQLDQQNALDPKTYQLIAARPVGVDRYLKIDKGASDGIKVGQATVFKENLLGQVIVVSEKGALIKLLKDPDSKIAAFSMGMDTRAKGVVVGQFGTDMLMDKILHEETIKAGDLVYSEGTEGFLPRGLILGKVVAVDERPNEVFKQAKIQPVFDIRDLELAFLIKE